MPDIYISTLELSGIDPETKAAKNVRVDFSPYRAWVVDTPEGNAWLTRNILRVRLPDGEATVELLATPPGNAYEVQERGFRGARHGYKVITDSDTNYADIPWVNKDDLQPEPDPSPGWAAEAVELAAGISAAQADADAAQATASGAASTASAAANAATAAQTDATNALSGLAGKASTTALTTAITNLSPGGSAGNIDTATATTIATARSIALTIALGG